jgi:AcrR family transcriptional regulator
MSENMKTKKDDVKKRIIDESIKLFLKKGFSGSSTNELVRLAGVSKGTLYWYFENKNDILSNILDKYYAEFLEVTISKINNYNGYFPNKFKYFYKFNSEFARDNRELLLVFMALLIEFAGTGSDIEKRMKEINNNYTLIIQKLIEDGIQDGTVRKDIDPVIYARFVASALMGSHLQWFLYLSSNEDDLVYNRKHAVTQRDELLKMLLTDNS